MAIFASTTLGSSDPNRAASIKALEAKAQALTQAQAKQEVPTSMPSPWQGAGYLANTLADAVATRRADAAAAQRRQDLAGYMANLGDNPTMAQVGPIMAADTDVGKSIMSEIQQRRMQAQQIQAQKEAAATLAETNRAAAAQQEEYLKARPQSEGARVDVAEARGQTSPEHAEQERQKLFGPSITDKEKIAKAEGENIDLQTTLGNLKEARALLEGPGVYSGALAGYRTDYGQGIPGALGAITGTSEEMTNRSKRFSQLMGPEVLGMLAKLKGSASDKDMKWAASTVNDPSASLDNKKTAVDILISNTTAHAALSERTLKEMGGKKVEVQQPAASAGSGDEKAAAKKWLAENPNDPRAAAVRAKLGL
jgi:hypothetical protein